MKRRTILLATAAAPLLALTACQGATTPQGVIDDAKLIADGLAGAIKAAQAAGPALIPATVAAKALGYVQQAQAALATLSGAVPAQAGATALSQVEGWINAALDTLATVPAIPPPYSGYIAAAAALLPVLEAFINQTVNVVGARSRIATMAPDQARAVLRKAAGR